jgi:hypothetical protein
MMPPPKPANDKNQVQVIARAAAILRVLEDKPLGLSPLRPIVRNAEPTGLAAAI